MDARTCRIAALTKRIARRAERLIKNPQTWRDRQAAEAFLRDIDERGRLWQGALDNPEKEKQR